jgi:hypothetical protein
MDNTSSDLTHNDVIKWLCINEYDNVKQINYTTIEILTLYINAQKVLYTEAKTFCEQKLYFLMIPTIILSGVIGLISFIFKDDKNSSTIIASISAFNSLLLTLVTYLKLDGKAEAHKISSNQFEKLQSICEFKCGKIMLLNEDIHEFIDDIEKRFKEIKETNQFILPEYIRFHFPYITHTNIFSKLREIQYNEELLINDVKDRMNLVNKTKNKIKELKTKKEFNEQLMFNIIKKDSEDYIQLINKLKEEIDNINNIIIQEDNYLTEYIKSRNDAVMSVIIFGKNYQNIDEEINSEIKHFIKITKRQKCNIMNWLKT